MLEDQTPRKYSSLYVRIFGGSDVSAGGPLFFLIMGIFCLLILFGVSLLGGTFYTGLFSNPLDNSGRPPVNFPFNGLIFISVFVGAFVGLFLGIMGLIWYSIFLKQNVVS